MTADIPVIKMTPSHSTHPKAQFILSPAQSRTTTIDERSVAPQEKSIMAEQDTQGSLEGQVLKMPPEGSDAPTEATRTTEPGLAFDHPQQRTDTVTQDTETTKTEYTSDSCKVNSQFENLPAELRRHILSMMELDSLNALVRASRVYFEQFREDHQNLLCQCLESTLGSVAADAYAVHQTSSKEFLNQRTPSKIREFLKSYHYLRSQSWFTPFHKVLDMEGALSTIKFHCSTVQPLARHFFSLALNYLDKETKRSLDHKPLSRTEEIRLMRALYRFQLCCNLYGLGFDDTLPDAESLELGKMVLDEFIAIFEPWESEEIFCFVLFAREKYEAIFDEIAWDVNEANPKYDDHRPGTPPGTFQLNGSEFTPRHLGYFYSASSRMESCADYVNQMDFSI